MPLQWIMKKTILLLYGTIKWQNVWHDDKIIFNVTIWLTLLVNMLT